jgi:predicted nucleotidyltransferase
MTVDQRILDKIVRRSVNVAHPGRVILFGSAARGQMEPIRDVALLVVRSNGLHRGQATGEPSSARLVWKTRAVALPFSCTALLLLEMDRKSRGEKASATS